RQREWLSRISRKDLNGDLDRYRVCSRHFVSGAAASLFDVCNPDWAPTQHLGYSRTLDKPNPSRYLRLSRRRQQLTPKQDLPSPVPVAVPVLVAESVPDPEPSAEAADSDEQLPGKFKGKLALSILLFAASKLVYTSCQTSLEGSDVQFLQDEVSRLTEELDQTKKALGATKFTEEALQGQDDKVSFYTGLPSYLALLAVFQLVSGHLAHSSQNVLGKFEEMMLFLVRLRLNCPEQDLAYRFGISQSTVSRVWTKWLDVFCSRMSPLIRCPPKRRL
ncbi:unnamed protein product, partial [Ixodes hexagonus]